ncbi:MAG: 2-hydroxychromene-2-carboxylate isomerase [Burkholderiales bacterium]|nr:2-hydroxychromene-2-carboxylate isomerase [Burkholderiales bacterium]
MPVTVHFHFDFGSPYGYIAAEKIGPLGARLGCDVVWKPFLIGAAMKAMGSAPMMEVPLKGAYAKRDFERSARFHGVPYRAPSRFPIGTVAAQRAFYWLWDRDPVLAKRYGLAVFRAYFVDDSDIGDAATVIRLAAEQGADAGALAAALGDAAVKDRLKTEVDAALAAGVFGSPTFAVGDELFWGVDRLDQLERWIVGGGF